MNVPKGWTHHHKTRDVGEGYTHSLYGAVVLRSNGQWEALGFNQQCFSVVPGPIEGMAWLKNAHDQGGIGRNYNNGRNQHTTARRTSLLDSTA